MTTTLTLKDLTKTYETYTTAIRCECEIKTDIVAGQPADEAGVRAFVKHHLELSGEDAEQAVSRILREEIGERNITPELGEIQERESYGVSCFRRDDKGRAWLGNWQIKANLKQAASRVGIFAGVRGTKGDMAEGGRVAAVGASLLDPEHPERIYPVDKNGKPATTYFREFMGRVHSPKGDVSIIHHSECIPHGCRFYFEYRYFGAKLKQSDQELLLAMSMQCGLGSVRSLEMGKFAYLKAELLDAEKTVKAERSKTAAA